MFKFKAEGIFLVLMEQIAKPCYSVSTEIKEFLPWELILSRLDCVYSNRNEGEAVLFAEWLPLCYLTWLLMADRLCSGTGDVAVPWSRCWDRAGGIPVETGSNS